MILFRPMRKGISILFLICAVILAGTLTVLAEEDQGLTVYNTRFVTNNKDATFIEGEVPVANGQTIILKAGFHAIAEKQMPNTGAAASFRIKIKEKLQRKFSQIFKKIRFCQKNLQIHKKNPEITPK